jgi:hypothetical protein
MIKSRHTRESGYPEYQWPDKTTGFPFPDQVGDKLHGNDPKEYFSTFDETIIWRDALRRVRLRSATTERGPPSSRGLRGLGVLIFFDLDQKQKGLTPCAWY